MIGRIALAGLALVMAVALGAPSPSAAADAVRVGSKNFTEQFILGEMYAAAFEASGIAVKRKINLGGTLIAHKALLDDKIDFYPEYIGTALKVVLKAPTVRDPGAAYGQVKAFYEREFEATWLKPSGIDNGYAMLVRPETASRHKLKTLSDLARVSSQLRIGAGPDFADRDDGLPGLKEKYGIEFAGLEQFDTLASRYDALAKGQVDVVNGFATGWRIAAGKLVALEDDKHIFPPNLLAPVVRLDALKANPRIEAIANRVSALVDNEVMRTLNQQVESGKEEPRDVAQAFLRSKGIVK